VSEFIPTSCIIAHRHGARGWLGGHSEDNHRLTLLPTCASPVRHGRIAIFSGEDLGRWLLGD
jgi:hypothetical protein